MVHIPETKEELEALCPLTPLLSENEYDRAVAIADTMAGYPLTPVQDEYFDQLTDLIGVYDDEHFPMWGEGQKS